MSKTLLLDLGNSRLKWGLAGSEAVTHVRALDYRVDASDALREFEALLDRQAPDAVVGCNVGDPEFAKTLIAKADQHDLRVTWLAVERESIGVRCAYAALENLGIDRWLAVLAAFDSTSAALVVDVGTAATIDAVSADGMHIGGMILPGLALMQQSLFARTSRIEKGADELRDPTSPIEFFASDTDEAVQNGCLLAVSAAVRDAYATLQSTDSHARLVLTGGGAAAILSFMPENTDHRPALVLEGLARRVAAS